MAGERILEIRVFPDSRRLETRETCGDKCWKILGYLVPVIIIVSNGTAETKATFCSAFPEQQPSL